MRYARAVTDNTAPARRLTVAAQRKLNQLVAQGVPLGTAMQQVRVEPGAFEEVVPVVAAAPTATPRPAWAGDRTDWTGAVEKLDVLRGLDRGRTVFGASKHRYELRPPVTEKQLVSIERKLGVALPPGLRAFYLTVGDGGAGPDYGLMPAAELKRRKPATAYPGIEALRAFGARTQTQPPQPTCAALSPSRLSGLVTIQTAGCTIFAAVVCTGDVGRIVHYDEAGISETDDTLVGWYERWLDDEIGRFTLIARMRDEGATLDAMARAMKPLLPADQAFRARDVVELKLRGLAPSGAAVGP